MANYLEVIKSVAADFVPPTSRYINSEVIRYTDEKKLTYKIYKRKPVPTSSNDRFMLLTKAEEFRPDIVSNLAYGTTDFWWRILDANNMNDIFDFVAGKTIRIPNNIGF